MIDNNYVDRMLKFIAKLFGTKSERDLKELKPYVGLVNAEYEKLSDLSNDELRARSQGLKDLIAERLRSVDDEIEALRQEAMQEPDVDKKEGIFKKIDDLELERNKQLEVILLEILPQAFAIVRSEEHTSELQSREK